MKVSIFLTSFGAMYCAGSKPFTSPAMRVGNALASKCVIGPMPLLPATTFCQAVATSLPTGETMPRPVTTTRRLFMGTPDSKNSVHASNHPWYGYRIGLARPRAFAPLIAPIPDGPVSAFGRAPARRLSPIRGRIVRGPSKRKLRTKGAAFGLPHRTRSRRRRARAEVLRSGLDVRLDVIHRLLDGGDLLGFLVGNFGFEFLFERHHQFHGVERIRAQIVNERGIRRDVLFLDTQLIDHDLLDALFDAAHETVPPGTLAFEVGTDPFPTRPARAADGPHGTGFFDQDPEGPVWRLLDLQIATRKRPYYRVRILIAIIPDRR